ncbi:glycosyltransferase [Flavobacteriaceae bacterium]|nr:glycosyltransferase [Flavobacteriaceae bacterium]
MVKIGILSRIELIGKGYDVLIQAIKCLKKDGYNVQLIVGGDEGEINLLKSIVDKENLTADVVFKGWILDKESFFNNIDIFCMPSTHETFGLSYLEAMKYSIPCIASDTDGALEIFTDNVDGIIIKKDKDKKIISKSIVNAVKNLIDNEDYRINIAQSGYNRAKDFDVLIISKKIKMILKEELSMRS